MADSYAFGVSEFTAWPWSFEPQPTAPEDRVRHIKDAITCMSPHVPQQTPFVIITGGRPAEIRK